MMRFSPLTPSKHPVIEGVRSLHNHLKSLEDQPVDQSFEPTSLCTFFLLDNPAILQQDHKLTSKLDRVSVSEYLEDLKADQSWPTLQMALRQLKLCRSLLRVLEAQLVNKIDSPSALTMMAIEAALILAPEIPLPKEYEVFQPSSPFLTSITEEDTASAEEPAEDSGDEMYEDSEASSFWDQQTAQKAAPASSNKESPSSQEESTDERTSMRQSSSQAPSKTPAPADGGGQTTPANSGEEEWRTLLKMAQQSGATNSQGSREAMHALKSAIRTSSHGDTKAVALAMKQFPGDLAVQARGCDFLLATHSKLVEEGQVHNVPHKVKGSKASGAKVLNNEQTPTSSSLDKEPTNPEDLSQSIFPESDPNITAILTAMRTFSSVPSIQKTGLTALAIFARASEDNLVRIVADGGILVIMMAMVQLADDEVAQATGLGVLGNPIINDSERFLRVTAASRRLVLAAMERFPSSVRIQGLGCLALANLAYRNDESLIEITEKGGVTIIIDAMQRFQNDPTVQSAACWALASLSSKDERIRVLIRGHGAVQLCQRAMEVFPNNGSVYDNATLAIGNLLTDEERLRQFSLNPLPPPPPNSNTAVAARNAEDCILQ